MDSPFSFLSSLAMFLIAAICTLGILSSHFKENLVQCAGMCFAATFAWMGVWSVDYSVEPNGLVLVSLGLSLFGIGTAWKHVVYQSIRVKRRFGQRENDATDHELPTIKN